MAKNAQGIPDKVYHCQMPQQQKIPFVFDSPHSGTIYPDDFGFSCDKILLEQSADSYVDELFEHVTVLGAPLLSALFPRCYIDLNRAVDDLDPELMEGDWPHALNPTIRSHLGVGLVHRLCRPSLSTPIYKRRIPVDEIRDRIRHYYRPYHEKLAGLIDDTHNNFGISWHLNCHSMPSTNAIAGRHAPRRRPDFVLGTRDGRSCAPDFAHYIQEILQDLGYHVTINHPYKGAELIHLYAQPTRNRNSIQVEINRGLYMNEESLEKTKGFKSLQQDLNTLCTKLADYGQSFVTGLAAD